MQTIDITKSILDIFPVEIVLEITDAAILSYSTGNTRWAQRCILAAVCKQLYTEYKPKRNYKVTAAMLNFLHNPDHIDLWIVMYRLGAKIDHMKSLKYTTRTDNLDYITELILNEYKLTESDYDELRMNCYGDSRKLVTVWDLQPPTLSYITKQFFSFRSVELYRCIKNKYPNPPIDLYEMIRKNISSAIVVYFEDQDLSRVPFIYVQKPGASPSLLANFMKKCDVRIKCNEIGRLICLIERRRYFQLIDELSNHASLLTKYMEAISPYIECDDCSKESCRNYIIINNFSVDTRQAVRESNIRSKYYKRSYGPATCDIIIDPLSLLSVITKNDDMFMLKDSYEQGMLNQEFIKNNISIINKSTHCRRWLTVKGIINSNEVANTAGLNGMAGAAT